MVNFIIKYLLIAIAVIVFAKYIDGIVIQDDNFVISLKVALAMGFVNTFLKPVLKIISFPITILSLGLFLLVINVILVYLVSHFVTGFQVHGFLSPLLFSFGISVVSTILGWILD